MKKHSLLTNYFYNFASQILTLLVPLITAPYLARVLHEVGNGQIAFVNSIVAYFTTFAGFGFSIYGQREIARYQDNVEEQSKIFLEIVTIKIVLTVFSLAVLSTLIAANVFGSVYNLLILLDAIQVVAVIFDIQFYYQGIEDFRAIAIRTIILRLIGIISVFAFVKSETDVWIYILCFAGSVFVSNILMWPSVVKKIDWKQIRNIQLLKHLWPSLLIFLPVISGTILSVIDATMIRYLALNSEYENGCYSTALKLVNMITLLVTVDSQVLASRNSRDFVQKNYSAVKKHLAFGFRYVWLLSFPLIVAVLLLSNQISLWFLGEGYEKVPALLRVFTVRIIAQGLISVIGIQYFIPIGKEKTCTLVNFFGISINFVLNMFFIPIGGCVGAAVASVVAEMVMLILYFFLFIRDAKFFDTDQLKSGANYLISALIMGIPVYLFSKGMSADFFHIILVTVIGVFAYGLCLIMIKDPLVNQFLQMILKRKKKL